MTCGYLRQNILEEVWADIFEVDQLTVSRYITFLTPLIEPATQQDQPTVITTPIRKPTCLKLPEREREWNSRASSFRAPVERAFTTLKEAC